MAGNDTAVRRLPGGLGLVVGRDVAAPAERVWSLLTDTTRWPEWGPSVTDVESTDRVIRAGTTGRVRTPVGVWVPFEVTACTRHYWTWRVARVPATGHRVDPLDAGRCRVSFEVPLFAVPYLPVCRAALDRIAALVE